LNIQCTYQIATKPGQNNRMNAMTTLSTAFTYNDDFTLTQYNA